MFFIELNALLFLMNKNFLKNVTGERIHYKTILNQSERIAKIGTWWVDINDLSDITSGQHHWSDGMYRLFGYLPGSVEISYDLYYNHFVEDDKHDIIPQMEKAFRNNEPFNYEYRIKRIDGEVRIILTQSEVLRDYKGNIYRIVGSSKDVTEIRKAELEKETLLKELYHRSKNNMQVISSILSLKAGALNDTETAPVLHDMRNRIQAIALVHQKLYQSKNLSSVDLGDYIKDLIDLIMKSYDITPDKVAVECELKHIDAIIDTAIPCGLMLSELITNSIKHAFPGDRKGKISVKLDQKENEKIELIVADDGVGFNEEDISEKDLGLQLFRIIAEQLEAEVEIETANGVKASLSFENNHGYSARV